MELHALTLVATRSYVLLLHTMTTIYSTTTSYLPPSHTNAMQRASNFTNFQEMTEEFQKTLRHDDFTYTTDLCTNLGWMETMVASLSHLQNSKFRCLTKQNMTTSRGGPTLVMSYTSTCDPKLIANLLHSISSRTISGHQKLLACWVHSGWEGGGEYV